MAGRNPGHLAHARDRFQADNVTLPSDRIIGEHSVRISAPALGEFAESAMEDHGEKIVN